MPHKDPEARKAYQAEYKKKWKAANPDKVKQSQRRQDLKKYGLTPECYSTLYEKQGGRCAICGTTEQKGGRFKTFCVDHDHETGRVRGLLCYDCNFGLGKFGDNISHLVAAIHYLQHP